MTDLKDDRLWNASEAGYNVAQFVSFDPGDTPGLRHSRVIGHDLAKGDSVERAVGAAFERWGDSANVRSFLPGQEQGNPFHYGVRTAAEAVALVRELAAAGYHTIVNETIDVRDGGVSGVLHGDLIEFGPEATPRIVENSDVTSLRRDWGIAMLAKVYGVRLELPQRLDSRTEFSIHPGPVGYRRQRTLVWEIADKPHPPGDSVAIGGWPNAFSRFVGDKAFGLLLADVAGFRVPSALLVGRTVAPFTFGTSTGTGEYWLRTCPAEKQAGRYPTVFGWQDPFVLMHDADPGEVLPDGSRRYDIASVLVQESVTAVHSGATHTEAGKVLVQGVAGVGDEFMLGREAPVPLPATVDDEVRELVTTLSDRLGRPARIEWVHDGSHLWVVQLGVERAEDGEPISDDRVTGWLAYDPDDGLDVLRALLTDAGRDGKGVTVLRPVGRTSHVGELIRSAGVAARFADSGP